MNGPCDVANLSLWAMPGIVHQQVGDARWRSAASVSIGIESATDCIRTLTIAFAVRQTLIDIHFGVQK